MPKIQATKNLSARLEHDRPLKIDQHIFGFGGVARIEESELEENWLKLTYPLKKNYDNLGNVHYPVAREADQLSFLASIALPLGVLNEAIVNKTYQEIIKAGQNYPQYMVVDLKVGRQKQPSIYLSTRLLPAMTTWLKDNVTPSLINGTEQAMYETYHISDSSRVPNRAERSFFRIKLLPLDQIQLSVPGDATALYMENNTDNQNGAYNLTPHDVSDYQEQLTLLSGIAFLGGLAVKAQQSQDYHRTNGSVIGL